MGILEQLLSFADVAELGSFSAAAAHRGVTQPAVSVQVKQLERSLGVQLIERIGRKATATAAGLELLQHASRINGELAAAREAMARHATGKFGRVRVGTGATACIYLLPPLLRDLRRQFPDLDIVISTGNTPEIVKAVEDNLLDVALVTMPASGKMLSFDVVVKDELLLFAPPKATLPARLSPAAVAKLPLISFERAGNTRSVVDQWISQAGIMPRPIMSLGSVEAIKELVSAGLGYAILPSMSLTPRRQVPALQSRPLHPRHYRELAIVLRKDKILNRGLREVVSALAHASSVSRRSK